MMEFESVPVMMSLPARMRADGASSPFHSPPLSRFMSDPIGEESNIARKSPRSRRKNVVELLISPNHSSAAASRSKSRILSRLISLNEASINSTPSEFQLLHQQALEQHPSPCGSPTPKKVHQYSSQEVAKMLTLIDAELLRQITPDELQNGAWMKKDLKHKLAPHVLAMVHASNNLAMLVPSEILAETTTHARAKVISSFIKIASKCYRLLNYNSLKAVLAGLQCTPIFRLKKTWKEVPSKRKKQFDRLSSIMSEEYNWSVYQQQLQEKMAMNQPCIPFLGVLLSNIAQQDAVCSASQGGSEFPVRRRETLRKISGVQDYVVLEAITVRNRLERLRNPSWRHSTSVASRSNMDHISRARQRALALRKKSRTMHKQISTSSVEGSTSRTLLKYNSTSSIEKGTDMYRSRTNAYSMSLNSNKIDSQVFDEDLEVRLLSPTEEEENEARDVIFPSDKDEQEGILCQNFSSSSESDDSPLVSRRAMNRHYQVPIKSETNSYGRTGHKLKSISESSLDSPEQKMGGVSVSEIDVSIKKKEQSNSPLNPVRLLSATDSDASSNSPAEVPRSVMMPRVSISHVEIDLDINDDSIFESKKIKSEMDLGLLPLPSCTIVPSRSLEGLCSSLEIEEDGQVRTSYQFGIGSFPFDKKSISMQSLLSESSSSSSSSSDCSTNPSTSSLVPPPPAAKLNRISSCTDYFLRSSDEIIPQPSTRQTSLPNECASLDRVYESLSILSNKVDDTFPECSIEKRCVSQPRCSIEMEGPVFLRPRRGGSTVQQIALTASPKLSTSTDLLNKYQFLSLGCCEGIKNIPELRELLTECPHNTEGQNYKLSYEREP